MRCAIGLGSNQGEPPRHLERAVAEIDALSGTTVTAVSSLYRTAPVGPVAQADFCNAVVLVQTTLQPRRLLDHLQALERAHGRPVPERRREPRWGPRALDLDLLLYGERTIDEPDLRVPHPRLHERAFVLVPLAEVAPMWQVPAQGQVDELAVGMGTAGVRRWQ